MAQTMEDPPFSRLFVVCGKEAESEMLLAAFSRFGLVQNVKLVKDKGIAFIKYERASSAALAMEALDGYVLDNGKGPKLKVLLADAPSPRGIYRAKVTPTQEISSDPDNTPPRSRLFLVVPKEADAESLRAEFSRYPDLDYCKTDLISAKGVAFCKFSKASSAFQALEAIQESNTVAGIKVKVMLAEPKTKSQMRTRDEVLSSSFTPSGYPIGPHRPQGVYGHDYNQNLSGSKMNDLSHIAAPGQQYQHGPVGRQVGTIGDLRGGPNTLTLPSSPAVQPVTPQQLPVSGQRLFVVVNKRVPFEAISKLFKRFPGCEYVDVKKERGTGKSKGFAFVNYSYSTSAAAAIKELNGVEFPSGSGHFLKVMYAHPLGYPQLGSAEADLKTFPIDSSGPGSLGLNHGSGPSPVPLVYNSSPKAHTPELLWPSTAGAGHNETVNFAPSSAPAYLIKTPMLAGHPLTPDPRDMQASLSSLSLVGGNQVMRNHSTGLDDGSHLQFGSNVPYSVARELMFGMV